MKKFMNLKPLALAVILLVTIGSDLSWGFNLRNFPKNAQEIYDELYSLKPGSSIDKAYAALGEPDFTDGNMLSWHLLGYELDVSFAVVIEDSIIKASAYFMHLDTDALFKRTYDSLREDLISIFGPPYQEVIDLFCIWHLGSELELALIKNDNDRELLQIGIWLKDRLYELSF